MQQHADTDFFNWLERILYCRWPFIMSTSHTRTTNTEKRESTKDCSVYYYPAETVIQYFTAVIIARYCKSLRADSVQWFIIPVCVLLYNINLHPWHIGARCLAEMNDCINEEIQTISIYTIYFKTSKLMQYMRIIQIISRRNYSSDG